ncbi:MAG: hypothetical protein CML12_03780 [Puniceicoccaceae bacterium]|nr:hypothetical protein [Puniceicoccaceae bacterium]|tara:strand:- start:227 stop:568 length:342 start_codon:yes stop_codon:yes gene_type:complete
MNENYSIELLARGDRKIESQLKTHFFDKPEGLAYLVGLVDAGSATLDEYLEALDYLSDWLKREGKCLSIQNKLQYLSCVEEARSRSGAGQWERFVHALESMLQDFGCERASDQ